MPVKLRQFLVLVWILASSVVLTIYLTWLLYPIAVDYFDLMAWAHLSRSAILSNFNQLMTYLLSPFVPHLQMTDFPTSASGLKHFADVKWLFQLAQGLSIILLYPSMVLLRRHYQSKTLWKWQSLWLSSLLLPIGIALIGLVIGFERFFTLFHQVLFPGDSSWLFNPQTDPVILILPAPFFLSCFILFFLIYEGLLLFLWFLSKKQWSSFREKLWRKSVN